MRYDLLARHDEEALYMGGCWWCCGVLAWQVPISKTFEFRCSYKHPISASGKPDVITTF